MEDAADGQEAAVTAAPYVTRAATWFVSRKGGGRGVASVEGWGNMRVGRETPQHSSIQERERAREREREGEVLVFKLVLILK